MIINERNVLAIFEYVIAVSMCYRFSLFVVFVFELFSLFSFVSVPLTFFLCSSYISVLGSISRCFIFIFFSVYPSANCILSLPSSPSDSLSLSLSSFLLNFRRICFSSHSLLTSLLTSLFFLSISLPLYLSISPSLSLYLSLSLSVSHPLYLSLPLYLSISPSLYIYRSLSIYLSLPLYLSIYLFIYLCLYGTLHLSLTVCDFIFNFFSYKKFQTYLLSFLETKHFHRSKQKRSVFFFSTTLEWNFELRAKYLDFTSTIYLSIYYHSLLFYSFYFDFRYFLFNRDSTD